jgi:phage anti-repressor protein
MNEVIPFNRLEMIAQSTETYPVDFDEAWQWVVYSTKQKARETLENNFEKDVDFNLNHKVKVQIEGGRTVKWPFTAIFLTADCFKAFCMMAGTQKGKAVRRYYLDIEKADFFLKCESRKA